jgi:hypothetical protein
VQVLVVLAADVSESACADADKSAKSFLLANDSLHKSFALRRADCLLEGPPTIGWFLGGHVPALFLLIQCTPITAIGQCPKCIFQ